MEKDREWKDKFEGLAKSSGDQIEKLKRKLGESEHEKNAIRKNYESQLNMMSEQLVELNMQNEKLKMEEFELQWMLKEFCVLIDRLW